jgi:D-alanyl-lipoteichoic acid acyltransferase DltB (MBOAT superfamily)
MLFNSFEYFYFLLVALPLVFLTKGKLQKIVLLGLSYYFYSAWEPIYLVLLLASTGIDFIVGRALEREKAKSKRKALLFLSLATNLGLLFLCKYLNLLVSTIDGLLDVRLPIFYTGLLPVGISFYTFQTLAYSVDVYRGKVKACHDPLAFALYVSFFPQLVAGPIERAQTLIPQLQRRHRFDADRFIDGTKRIVVGLFKKVCLGDRLAAFVDPAFASAGDHSGGLLLIVALAFYGQIYWDFSGYCDIAIGTSRILGIRLMENFRRPYLAVNIGDFWSRWHISLSTWFRDYLYVPLGGNRVGHARWAFNVAIVFLLSGLWHGANWTFLAWGGLHSLYYFIERAWGSKKLPAPIGRFITFVGVTLAWIVFRATDVEQAFTIFGRIATWAPGAASIPSSPYHKVTLVLCLLALWFEHYFDEHEPGKAPASQRRWLRILAYCLLVVCIILWGDAESRSFVYFQF